MKQTLSRHAWWAIHATRMLVASLLTLGVVYALGLTVELSAVISAIVATQANIGGSLRKAFEQGAGSLAGAAVAAVVALVLQPDDPGSTAIALAIALVPLAVMAAFSAGFQIAPITATVVLLGAPGLEVGPEVLALERVGGVAIGLAIGLAAGILVFPAKASRSAVEAAARLAGLLAAQMRALSPDAGTGEAALTARAGEIRSELMALSAFVTEAARERRLAIGKSPDPDRVLRALRRVRHDVNMLRRAARGGGDDALPDALAEPWRRATAGAAGALDQVEAQLVRRPILGPLVPLEPIVRDYRDGLDAMRSAGRTEDLSTPDLARLFGIKFALRQLERDLATLTDVATEITTPERHWRRR
ncbi:FUSC family protein [Limimaricola litoreus]|uniref:FUSC family protein n=1 Tax=Limimaricola litoreus TaxID=2955316 RepID=A0A9X2FQN2_9RHOB|nr:FUSC family protein [Limimaricola litoreus]MCP1169909.1 FUSC family protein [Limimaricola litoreus]